MSQSRKDDDEATTLEVRVDGFMLFQEQLNGMEITLFYLFNSEADCATAPIFRGGNN